MTSFDPAGSIQQIRSAQIWIAVLTVLALACAACSKAPPPAAHPVEVATVIVHPQATSFPEDFVAETEAVNAIEIQLGFARRTDADTQLLAYAPVGPGNDCRESRVQHVQRVQHAAAVQP